MRRPLREKKGVALKKLTAPESTVDFLRQISVKKKAVQKDRTAPG